MFSETLVESSSHRYRPGWPALWSVMLQGSMVALLALLPLLNPDVFVLPSTTPLVPLSAPLSAQPEHQLEHTSTVTRSSSQVLNVNPRSTRIEMGDAPPSPGPAPAVPSGIPGTNSSLLGKLPTAYNVGPPPPAVPESQVTHPVKPSVLMEGNLVHKVQPDYPYIARQMHLQGTVRLRAVIGADGLVHDVHAISGPAPLAQSAMAAVRQWRYRPYVLNGQPIEVESQITVNFVLSN